MGKRSDFERNERDYYPTPLKAVIPLIRFLKKGQFFIEPMAGNNALVQHLESFGCQCVYASDIEPQSENVVKRNAFDLEISDFLYITNPPWERHILHKVIEKFRQGGEVWLLFDSDWAYTGQAAPYLEYCSHIVTVGRVSWMENGTSGMDNCCWYRFQSEKCETVFYGAENKTERCPATVDMFDDQD